MSVEFTTVKQMEQQTVEQRVRSQGDKVSQAAYAFVEEGLSGDEVAAIVGCTRVHAYNLAKKSTANGGVVFNRRRRPMWASQAQVAA